VRINSVVLLYSESTAKKQDNYGKRPNKAATMLSIVTAFQNPRRRLHSRLLKRFLGMVVLKDVVRMKADVGGIVTQESRHICLAREQGIIAVLQRL